MALSKPSTLDPELAQRLVDPAGRKITPAEIWHQRISFAFGQLPLESTSTRDDIERMAVEMYGPCPSDESPVVSETAREVPAVVYGTCTLCGVHGAVCNTLECARRNGLDGFEGCAAAYAKHSVAP